MTPSKFSISFFIETEIKLKASFNYPADFINAVSQLVIIIIFISYVKYNLTKNDYALARES